MAIPTINKEPWTLNICYRDGGDVKTATITFARRAQALQMARDEVVGGSTIHATVTHEPTGTEIFDAPGVFMDLLGSSPLKGD